MPCDCLKFIQFIGFAVPFFLPKEHRALSIIEKQLENLSQSIECVRYKPKFRMKMFVKVIDDLSKIESEEPVILKIIYTYRKAIRSIWNEMAIPFTTDFNYSLANLATLKKTLIKDLQDELILQDANLHLSPQFIETHKKLAHKTKSPNATDADKEEYEKIQAKTNLLVSANQKKLLLEKDKYNPLLKLLFAKADAHFETITTSLPDLNEDYTRLICYLAILSILYNYISETTFYNSNFLRLDSLEDIDINISNFFIAQNMVLQLIDYMPFTGAEIDKLNKELSWHV